MNRFNDLEKFLSEMPVPKVMEGPHRQRLRRELLQQFQPAHRPALSGPWWWQAWSARVAAVCGVALLAGAAAWGGQKLVRTFAFFGPVRNQVLYPATPASGATQPARTSSRSVTGAFVGEVVTLTSDNPTEARRQYEQYEKWREQKEKAINAGQFKLVQTKAGRFGLPIYIYDLRLPDGQTVRTPDDHAWIQDPRKRQQNDAELAQACAENRGEVVGTLENDLGTTTYIHKVTLADGSVRSYGSDEPDSQTAKRHQDELAKAQVERRGDFVEVVDAPGGTKVYLYRVVLSDGTARTYGSDKPPVNAGTKPSKP